MQKYLVERGISESVIDSHGIHEKGSRIVIPVRDKRGATLFNKYRRSPLDSTGPKYTYDPGASVALYNIESLFRSDLSAEIYFCEGELDALVLESKGFTAVSSTGGSRTWEDEWSEYLLDREVYIVYDRDVAGVRGSLNIATKLPNARMVELPAMEGKDVTDFFKSHSREDWIELIENSRRWPLPTLPEGQPKSKAERDRARRELARVITTCRERKNEERNNRRDGFYDEAQENHWIETLERYNKPVMNGRRKSDKAFETDVEKAKSVPITEFITVDATGKSLCIFHSESTPSLHYYSHDNHLYCFGGCGYKDVIDVVQEKQGLDFKEAVRYLIKQHVR